MGTAIDIERWQIMIDTFHPATYVSDATDSGVPS
jgi:hypothetical protein